MVHLPKTRRRSFSSFRELLRLLRGLPDLERTGLQGAPAGPRTSEATARLLASANVTPPQLPPSIWIAGSKGKGSTAMMTERLLRASGLRTGLYLSPHLSSRQERIQLEGLPASPRRWCEAATLFAPALQQFSPPPSRFEVETALALLLFWQQEVDVAIVEAGMGATGDATDLLSPCVTALTSIEVEHPVLLGRSLEAVARQKAGVLRPHTPAILGNLPPSVRPLLLDIAQQQQTPLLEWGIDFAPDEMSFQREGSQFRLSGPRAASLQEEPLFLGALGRHQIDNAVLALALADTFCQVTGRPPLDPQAAETLRHPNLVGRLQPLPPDGNIILDAAHTPGSVEAAIQACLDHRHAPPAAVLFGLNKDKDLPSILHHLQQIPAHLLLVPLPGPRTLSPQQIASHLPSTTDCSLFADIPSACRSLRRFLSEKRGPGLLLGSFRLAGEALSCLAWPPLFSWS